MTQLLWDHLFISSTCWFILFRAFLEMLAIQGAAAAPQQITHRTTNLSPNAVIGLLNDPQETTDTSIGGIVPAAAPVRAANSSLLALNVSLPASITCSGTTFGFDVELQSCLESLSSSQLDPHDNVPQTWG